MHIHTWEEGLADEEAGRAEKKEEAIPAEKTLKAIQDKFVRTGFYEAHPLGTRPGYWTLEKLDYLDYSTESAQLSYSYVRLLQCFAILHALLCCVPRCSVSARSTNGPTDPPLALPFSSALSMSHVS